MSAHTSESEQNGKMLPDWREPEERFVLFESLSGLNVDNHLDDGYPTGYVGEDRVLLSGNGVNYLACKSNNSTDSPTVLLIPSADSLDKKYAAGVTTPQPNYYYHTEIICSTRNLSITVFDGGNPSLYGATGIYESLSAETVESVILTRASYDTLTGKLQLVEFGFEKEADEFLDEVISDILPESGDEDGFEPADENKIIDLYSQHIGCIPGTLVVDSSRAPYWMDLTLFSIADPEEPNQNYRFCVNPDSADGTAYLQAGLEGKIENYGFKISAGILTILIERSSGLRKKITLPLSLKPAALKDLAEADLQSMMFANSPASRGLGLADGSCNWAGYDWGNIVRPETGRQLSI